MDYIHFWTERSSDIPMEFDPYFRIDRGDYKYDIPDDLRPSVFYAIDTHLDKPYKKIKRQVGSMMQIMAIPEMLVYYRLLPFMFLGYRFIMKHKVREGGPLIVYIFIMMLVLAFIEGNIGTLFRHRAMVLPFMFVLIGIGLEKIKFRITAHS